MVRKDDRRAQASLRWCKHHITLNKNVLYTQAESIPQHVCTQSHTKRIGVLGDGQIYDGRAARGFFSSPTCWKSVASLTAWMKRFFFTRRRSSLASLSLSTLKASWSPFDCATNLRERRVFF